MRFIPKIKEHPLPFLLYAEWAVLFVLAVDEALIFPGPRPWFCKFINLIAIGIFFVMGFDLPLQKKLKFQLGYIGILIGLFTLTTTIGLLNLGVLFLILLFIRHSVIFYQSNLWLTTGFYLVLFTLIQSYRLIFFPVPFPPPPFASSFPFESASVPKNERHFHGDRPPPPPPPTQLPPFMGQMEPLPPLGFPGPPPPGKKPGHPHFHGPPPPPPMGKGKFEVILWSFRLLLGVIFLLIKILISAVISERKSRQDLAIAHDKLRRYALMIENMATVEERNRIAREIHDSLGHYLTVLNINLEAAWKLQTSSPDEAVIFLAEAKKLGSQALHEVRESVAALRSNPLQGKSLSDAIAELISELQKSTSITPIVSLNLPRSIPNEIKTTVYRIIQEALTNVCKYGNATEVKIIIFTNDVLHLMIEDNGIGFVLDQNTTGFGLQGMRERALAVGGTFSIVTAPGQGCQIQADIPLP